MIHNSTPTIMNEILIESVTNYDTLSNTTYDHCIGHRWSYIASNLYSGTVTDAWIPTFVVFVCDVLYLAGPWSPKDTRGVTQKYPKLTPFGTFSWTAWRLSRGSPSKLTCQSPTPGFSSEISQSQSPERTFALSLRNCQVKFQNLHNLSKGY